MLVSDHFFLFLKVAYYLGQRLLQNLNLVLVRLDLVRLIASALLVLLFSPSIDSNITFDFAIGFLLLLNLFLVLLKLVALRDSLQSQVLIFIVDLTLNRQDSSLGLLLCLLLELFELFLILRLNLELHLGELDLIFVLGARDFVLEH